METRRSIEKNLSLAMRPSGCFSVSKWYLRATEIPQLPWDTLGTYSIGIEVVPTIVTTSAYS